MKHHIIFVMTALSLVFVSCEKIAFETEAQDGGIVLGDAAISFATRSGGNYTDFTYRFCLFNTTTHFYSGLSGTYCDPNPAKDLRWLTPCKVDAVTGAYASGDASPEATIHGLQARNGTYYMAIASPAVAMVNTTADPKIYGFLYSRERPAGEKVLCISDSIKAVVSGLNINSTYLYIVNDTIRLKERRSKLKISISCGDDIESAIVKRICLSNIINQGWHLPVDMCFEYLNSNIGSTDVKEWTPPQTLYKADDAGQGHQKTYICESQPYVLSMDYSKVDIYQAPLFPLPSIDVYLGSDGDTEVKIPIAYNLLPENIYSCNITINSCYVTVTLSVLDWGGPNNATGEMDYPLQRPLTVTVDTWSNGVTGSDNGTTEIHDSAW